MKPFLDRDPGRGRPGHLRLLGRVQSDTHSRPTRSPSPRRRRPGGHATIQPAGEHLVTPSTSAGAGCRGRLPDQVPQRRRSACPRARQARSRSRSSSRTSTTSRARCTASRASPRRQARRSPTSASRRPRTRPPPASSSRFSPTVTPTRHCRSPTRPTTRRRTCKPVKADLARGHPAEPDRARCTSTYSSTACKGMPVKLLSVTAVRPGNGG